MFAYFEDKRAECLEEIAECEKELETAQIKLKLLNEIITEAVEYAKEEVAEETTEANDEVEITHTGYIE